MSESDLWKSNEYLRERNEELEQQSKETEKKIKEIVKDFTSNRDTVCPVSKRDKLVFNYCIKNIKSKFPEYFKESD